MTYMNTKKREIVRMGLTVGAKQKLDNIAAAKDMKLIGVLSRLVEWFVDQDKTLQSVVLGLIDEKDAPEVLGLIHKRLAEDITKKHIPPDTGKTLARQRISSDKGGKKE